MLPVHHSHPEGYPSFGRQGVPEKWGVDRGVIPTAEVLKVTTAHVADVRPVVLSLFTPVLHRRDNTAVTYSNHLILTYFTRNDNVKLLPESMPIFN